MEEVLQIERACASNNHDTVMSVLNSIDSFDSKKQAFLKIIEYHKEQSRFPVGYIFLFIRWLLQNNDRKTAMEYILKCRQNGVAEDRISHLIYETIIKPDESFYKNNFNKNLRLLQQHKILISDRAFDFDQIKKQVQIITNCHPPVPESLLEKLSDADKVSLIVDITDMDVLIKVLNAVKFTYLVYDDVQEICYMLLFEDLSRLSEHIEYKKIIFFDGTDERLLLDFFANLYAKAPDYVFGMTANKKYDEILDKINKSRSDKALSIMESLNTFYKNHNDKYYRELLRKEPSEIKIMLVTSETTELNKFIVKNWHQAFFELGYDVQLLIENNPYEHMTNFSLYELMNEFKPDIVFHINWTVNILVKKGELQKNLLWIMRYRDTQGCELHYASPGYEYNNMFILPALFEWAKKMRSIGIPENRILLTSDGINTSVFAKKDKIVKQYACDIAAVNNAAGSESFRLDFYFNMVKDIIGTEPANKIFKKIVLEQVNKLKETANDEKNIFIIYDSGNIIDSLMEKLSINGLHLNESARKLLVNLFVHIIDSMFRGRIMEWIIDSGLTSNIKLWGKGWSNNEKFKKFHMGIARHGEELSSIYRSSKISISDNPWALHERNFEVFASGGFSLIRHVKWPEIENPNKITNYFRENEEVVLFYSKDDLLNKIQYYLDNPEERGRIAENGRQVVINNFSHLKIAKKTMDFIKDYYKD
jgi:spore maturation protein CgeB